MNKKGNSKTQNKYETYFSDLIKSKAFNERILELRANLLCKKAELNSILQGGNAGIKTRPLEEEIRSLCFDFSLNEMVYGTAIENLIYDKNFSLPLKDDLCKISDDLQYGGKFELVDDYAGSNELLEYATAENVNSNIFPVILHISPYASERDILNFVKKNFSKLIKPIQDKYIKPQIKLGKTRTRKKTSKK